MKQAITFLLLLTITACVPLLQQRPETSPDSLWQQRYQALKKLDQWQFQGRTVIRQGKEALNAGLRWQANHNSNQIKIEGPFAQGGIALDCDDQQAVLTMADGEKILATNPETLIQEVLGVSLPIDALDDWVRGMPDPSINIDRLELDNKGQVTHLIQQGWDIQFLRYVPFEGHTLPVKIFIDKQDLSLRLVITRWASLP